jgi:hypothetical protein|tara:strand:- start:338 stop:511 length:174 start_codon:yes stop_codon:yes gene_type:complete
MDNMTNIEEMQKEYVKSFNEKEKKAYEIAKSHLGMSFDLEKSIGFREWKQKQQQQNS